MFEDFFESNAPVGGEKPGEERREQIKAAVMERISQESEDKKMKHRFIRPFLIAAAVAAVGAGSIVTADAATGGAVSDSITKAFSVFVNVDGAQVEANGEIREVENADGSTERAIFVDIPEDMVNGEDNFSVIVDGDGYTPAYITFSQNADDSANVADSEETNFTKN